MSCLSILNSLLVPASSMLSACYCMGRHCVLRSLVVPRCDSCFQPILCTPVCCAQQSRRASRSKRVNVVQGGKDLMPPYTIFKAQFIVILPFLPNKAY